MGKRLEAVANAKGKSWVYAETVVWALFVVVAVIGGAILNGWLPHSKDFEIWVGRVLISFGLLAFFYLTFKASEARSN